MISNKHIPKKEAKKIVEDIAELTDLSIDEIEKIKIDLNQ